MDSLSLDNLQPWIELITAWGLKLLIAIVILLIGRWAAGMTARLVDRGLEKREADPALRGFLSGLVRWTVLLLTFVVVLDRVGIKTTSFVAILGAAGLAVGLALQGSLANFASGVLLLLFRPFTVGDYVEIGGVSGVVESIAIFTTTLNTPDNKRVIIPNAVAGGGTITNFSANDTRRIDMVVGIGYGDDIGKARDIAMEVMQAHDKVLSDPGPSCAVGDLGDSSVNLNVRPWVAPADYWGVRSDILHTIKLRYDEAGISIPFPQTEITVVKND